MDILTRYDLDAVEAQTDVIGDVDAWMAAYEQGAFALGWDMMEAAAKRMLAEWRDQLA